MVMAYRVHIRPRLVNAAMDHSLTVQPNICPLDWCESSVNSNIFGLYQLRARQRDIR